MSHIETDTAHQIMRLVDEVADAKAAHAVAVHEFANDRAEYEPIVALAQAYQDAVKALWTELTR